METPPLQCWHSDTVLYGNWEQWCPLVGGVGWFPHSSQQRSAPPRHTHTDTFMQRNNTDSSYWLHVHNLGRHTSLRIFSMSAISNTFQFGSSFSLWSKWHPIPYVVHYFWLVPYGLWTKVGNYIGIRMPFGTQAWSPLCICCCIGGMPETSPCPWQTNRWQIVWCPVHLGVELINYTSVREEIWSL